MALQFTRDRTAAEDLVQETMFNSVSALTLTGSAISGLPFVRKKDLGAPTP